MPRAFRLLFGPVVVAVVAGGLVLSADPAGAQPPFGQGKGFQKQKGFEKGKGFPKDKDREAQKKGERDDPAETLRRLEAELDRVKEREAELRAQMRRLKESKERGPMPREGGPMGAPFGRGPGGFGPRGMGPMGPFGGTGFGGPGQAMLSMMLSPEVTERMSAEELRDVIGRLQRALEEKTRGGERGDRAGDDRGGERPRGVPQDEILRRLDRLTAEVEELKRSNKK